MINIKCNDGKPVSNFQCYNKLVNNLPVNGEV